MKINFEYKTLFKYDYEEIIFLIDEPELSLNYNLQFHLSKFLAKTVLENKHITFIISTHSPFMVSDPFKYSNNTYFFGIKRNLEYSDDNYGETLTDNLKSTNENDIFYYLKNFKNKLFAELVCLSLGCKGIHQLLKKQRREMYKNNKSGLEIFHHVYNVIEKIK